MNLSNTNMQAIWLALACTINLSTAFSLNLNFNFDALSNLNIFSYSYVNSKIFPSILDKDQQDQRLSTFINEIETFESSKSDLPRLISALNSDNIKHYSQDPENTPIFLDQYQGQYILRIYDWDDIISYDNGKELTIFEDFLLTIKEMNISVWEKSISHKFIDVQVDKIQGENLLSNLSFKYPRQSDFRSKIVILDLPQTVFETYPEAELESLTIDTNLSTNSELFFKNYRDADKIYAWYDLLLDTYPDILSVEYIGNTYEGRPMKAIRLSVHSEKKSKSIKTVVITSGMHAREWIGISSSCYILFHLLSDYENGNLAVKKYLENLDFLFLPVMNPDGYQFSWKTERLWKKNKQQTYNPRCHGIDIDHSFDFHFTSGFESPCSEDYAGESQFEALESYNWDNYLNETKHSHPIYAYIDLHSYAEEVLYPYAYSCDILPRDEENLLELAYGLSQAIRLNSGKYYSIAKACEDKGADLAPSMGAGSALDYMYHNKAYWAFVLKLRDSGTHGFLLPPKYIVPVGEEIYASVKYFAAFLLSDRY